MKYFNDKIYFRPDEVSKTLLPVVFGTPIPPINPKNKPAIRYSQYYEIDKITNTKGDNISSFLILLFKINTYSYPNISKYKIEFFLI